jgi:hypothetical protein
MAANPYRDKSVKGDPYRRVAADRFQVAGGALGPHYAQLDKNGRGVGLGPTRVPDGETFTNAPGGHGVDVPKGGTP